MGYELSRSVLGRRYDTGKRQNNELLLEISEKNSKVNINIE